jgi:hypothetical protein
MNKDQFFCHLNSAEIANLIMTAQKSVVYAAPSIQLKSATAMVNISEQLGVEMLTVTLDIDEWVLRMGYGKLEAIQKLQDANIVISHSPQIRGGLLIVDDQGFSFTPTALYLEAENNNPDAYNAIRLTSEQVKEALARLSPVAKCIAIAQAKTQEEKQKLKEISVDIPSKPLEQSRLEEVSKSIKEVPPVEFDIARQVRVYSSYLQYVEISLTGAAIQRHKLVIPKELQMFGVNNKEIENRLRTTFDLLDKSSSLSSKTLEDELNKIRDDFAPSLGKNHGRVLLQSSKKLFKERIAEFETKLKQHIDDVKKSLETELDNSKSVIAEYYLPFVKNAKPDSLSASFMGEPTDDKIKEWIKGEFLDSAFPKLDKLTMKLNVSYKDVTFETLNQNDFLEAVKKAFPYENWDKTYQEFQAAAQKDNKQSDQSCLWNM